MKSIRLSLLLYFLVLLTIVLGAVSLWAYQFTEGILEVNGRTGQEHLRQQCDLACEREDRRFEQALWQRAVALANQARFQHQFDGIDFHGYVLVEEQPGEYLQINSERRKPWHSSSMGDRSFAFDLDNFREMDLFVPEYDDTDLTPALPLPALFVSSLGLVGPTKGFEPLLTWSTLFPGRGQPPVRVRRVALKTPYAWRSRAFWPAPREQNRQAQNSQRSPEGRSQQGGPDAGRRPPPPPQADVPAPALYVQCAAETTQRDLRKAVLREQLERDLANLHAESATTLATLRDRLLLIGLITFSATVAGGVWLVRLGLSPLQRLSLAVSQVSAKDFRLPFDEPRLPRELRPIVERLTQTLELLKRTFAREKQAAADISHELRTPLAALLTTIEVALRKQRSPEEYRELLTDCHATGQQMSQLIERLLALARLDAGVDTLRPREVDASNLAEQCATLVRPLVAARGLTLRVERNGPVVMQTDPEKLREVLTNLLHNAIEYNRPEGSIELALERQNGHVLVQVKDTGIGIAPAAREHIFERFYRADQSRHADGLHAGLGLAIVKGYIDLMGGKISVDSTEGQGTTFRVELPAGCKRDDRPEILA